MQTNLTRPGLWGHGSAPESLFDIMTRVGCVLHNSFEDMTNLIGMCNLRAKGLINDLSIS